MPASPYGFSLAEALRDRESIRSAKTQNALSELQLSKAQREEAQRPERERLAKERANLLSGLRQEASMGSEEAQRRLLALDPEGGASFVDAVAKMDERARNKTKATVDEIGRVSAFVLQGKTPEEQQRRFEGLRTSVSPEVAKSLPRQFDPAFFEVSLAKASAMDQILEAPTVRQIGGEDVVFRGGREIERAARPQKAGSGSAAEGPKTADLRRFSNHLSLSFDGVLKTDPETGTQYVDLSGEDSKLVQAAARKAVQLVRQGKPFEAALEEAAREFNIPTAKPVSNDPSDPDNIRRFLTQ